MRRRRLFWKYTTFFVLLVTAELLASGITELYFSYQENQAALVALQREKALAAASQIENFIKEIERQMGWVTQPQRSPGGTTLEQRRFDFFRLQRQVPAITEVSYIDAAGREQLRVSRLAMDAIGSQADLSGDPRFVEAKARRVYRGPVYFRKESEPYMVIAIAEGGQAGGVTAAEVNLKFIWDVVSQIKIGKAGQAFVVDGQGALIAHPDISLVLQKTDLTRLEQVKRALAGAPQPGATDQDGTIARNLRNQQVLTAHTAIPSLGWTVFAEQPLEEAFEPLRASVKRTVLLLILGILLSVGASLVLARTLARPIRALQAGAVRIGEGNLTDRIEVKTGDELEVLADQFNRMAVQLQESYAGLERKVDVRTRELQEALEQQTATAEILGVISGSPTDSQPVMDAVAQSAARLCDAVDAQIFRIDGDVLRSVAIHGSIPKYSGQPITRGFVSGRAVIERRTVHVHDLAEETEREFPDTRARQQATGTRTVLATPLLREGVPIGVILIRRLEVRSFTDKQIALLETFADQAVIAIENVRLFQELQARTQDLSQSLEETGALSEVIRAVSSSLDLREVLDTVARRAVALSGADGCGIFELRPGRQAFDVVVSQGLSSEFVDAVLTMSVGVDHGTISQATETGEPVQIPDVEEAHGYPFRPLFLREGLRSVLTVPMGGGDDVARGIVVVRRAPGAFGERIVNLMKALANQSKVAIANANLFREIEEKSRLLEVANRHKSEFLANMSHELRTPLNAIIGFSEVLLQRMFGELNPKQDEYLQDVLSSGRHLLSLINDILDLSKVEAGRMELELARFDLPQAMQDTLVLVRERAARHGIELHLAVDGGLGAIVADERKIKQVMLNLLSNAVKFTPEGGRVDVRTVATDGGVEISVADTGIGIAPENQELIFEEFRQVGGDYVHKREGTGLGLTLARRFVELHGGRIWVKSQPGQGSTFTFSIPERPWPAS
jgi:signal transduction histidine kinase/HAMP domain-containing protein/putative methionine-R-sulfoxide reductase with GAF domain